MKILIVEDYGPQAFLVAALCGSTAKRIELAYTMAAAWEWLRKKNGFDLVFLDLSLPDSTRQMTLDAIRMIKQTGRKVAVMTGGSVEDEEYLALRWGADAWFSKDDPDFMGKVQSQLGIKHGGEKTG